MRRLRELRRARGWSQARLAGAAGVSRQLVSAVEAGRHEPGVAAALALARALGTDVETLCGPPPTPVALGLDGRPLPDGPVALTRVGDQLVGVPVPRAAQLAGHPVDGDVRAGHLRGRTAGPARLLAVGCDPALGLLGALAPPAVPVLWAPQPSAVAAVAAAAARAHVAVVHDRPGEVPDAGPAVTVRPLARVRIGLAHAPGRRRTPTALASRGPVVQRPDGATSQAAFRRWLHREGIPAPAGPRAVDHLDAARLVAGGAAPLGVTSEAAAVAFGLCFVPLEEHDVALWVRTDLLDDPRRTVVELVDAPEYRDRLRSLPGYDRPRAG